MKTSVIITVLNECRDIKKSLNSLLKQNKTIDGIIITDAGSTDGTLEILKDYEKRYENLHVIVKPGCSRAQGRNIGIAAARGDIIATTDAGCRADKNWLKELTEPFKDETVDVVAGFYKMEGDSGFQKALGPYLGITPQAWSENFLPSARSMAFRKNVWRRVGGFPEDLTSTAEDTAFNNELVKNNMKIIRVEKAIVYWRLPHSISEAAKKFYKYAEGDARSGIWIHSSKGIMSHNVRVLLVFTRYLFGLTVLILSLFNSGLIPLVVILLVFYLIWSYYKTYSKTRSFKSGLWGVVIQLVSDAAVMTGFLKGTLTR